MEKPIITVTMPVAEYERLNRLNEDYAEKERILDDALGVFFQTNVAQVITKFKELGGSRAAAGFGRRPGF